MFFCVDCKFEKLVADVCSVYTGDNQILQVRSCITNVALYKIWKYVKELMGCFVKLKRKFKEIGLEYFARFSTIFFRDIYRSILSTLDTQS